MTEAETIRKRVGSRIREARGHRSVREIADALTAAGYRVSVQAIYQWENGDTMPSIGRAPVVAEVLGVPWADLFAPDDEAVA